MVDEPNPQSVSPLAPVESSLPPTMPTPAVAPDPYVTIDIAPTEIREWRARIDAAIKMQQTWHPWWDAAIKDYAPRVSDTPDSYALRVRCNRSFVIVERKTADLFYNDPEVTVSPSPLIESMPNGAQMTAAHATILRDVLGLFRLNAKKVAGDALFANELFGAGWTKIFYRAYTQDVEQAVTDPVTGAPVLDEMGQPKTETVPVPIFTECGWDAYGNKQALIPDTFRSTDTDKAPWLGMLFTMNTRNARAMWKGKIPDDFKGSGGSGKTATEQFFNIGGSQDGTTQASKDTVTGVEILFKSMLFRDNIVHPERMTRLVFIDGIDAPVEYRDSPDQTVTEQGQLTPDSLIGFPYHPIITRTMTDSAQVMSDVAIALPITNQLDKFRHQGVVQRAINMLRFYYNTSTLPEADVEKLITAPQGGMVGLTAEAFADPNGPIRPFPTVPMSPDSYQLDAILNRDLEETFAIDANSAGVNAAGDQTATESNIGQANRNVRIGKEQSAVADWYVRFVGKLSTLIQRYFTVEEAAAIVGQEQAQAWDQWRKTIPTRLAFKMTPDSSLRNDTPLERKQLQDVFTYIANDPSTNRQYLLTKLLEKFHIDPTRALLPPNQIPPPKKDDPSIGLSFKGDDLSPLSPQSAIVLDILTKAGIQIDPNAMQAAQLLGQEMAHAIAQKSAADAAADGPGHATEHAGKVPQMPSLDKHAAALTGGMDGTGAQTPAMSPMGVQ